MKKSLLFTLMITLALSLVGCTSGGKTETTSTTDTDTEVSYDLQGQDFIIYANNPISADPFSDGFEGLYQVEKQLLQNAVEEKFNVNIVYTNFPASASWGVARENWIINGVVSGNPAGHVYQMSSTSIPTLANAGAIIPLEGYFDDYADQTFLDSVKKDFGFFKDSYYVYDDKAALVESGIYYNQDLLVDLGYDADYPSQLWAEGNWNWESFLQLANDLNAQLDQDDGQYVMGGRPDGWAYQLMAANGSAMIDSDLTVGLTKPESLEAMNFLADLYKVPGMWNYEGIDSFSVEPKFNEGKVVFHNGEYWFLFVESRFGQKDFDNVGFVPFPTGPNTNEDLSNYKSTIISGPAVYILSNGYKASDVPAGYEGKFFTEETIFQIWSELQYFDDYSESALDFGIKLLSYYADSSSVDAHMSIINDLQNELLYAFGAEASGHVADSWIMLIRKGIVENNVRSEMETLEEIIKNRITEKFE